jgi:hypothetical protein
MKIYKMKKQNQLYIILAIIIILVVLYYQRNRSQDESSFKFTDLSFGSIEPVEQSGVLGCTDQSALNYEPTATIDSGNCFYVAGCCDVNATNYNAQADSCSQPNNNQIMCVYDQNVGSVTQANQRIRQLIRESNPFSRS